MLNLIKVSVEHEICWALSKLELSTKLARLDPIEENILPQTASAERILQFRQARLVAKSLIKKLFPEQSAFEIITETSGRPIFPVGINGSLAHTKIGEYSYAAAIISKSNPNIGIDLEALNRVISKEVAQLIKAPTEELKFNQQQLLRWFSAKEAIFKGTNLATLADVDVAECASKLQYFEIEKVLLTLYIDKVR